ncbi:MAG: zinc-ribbon domain-containing protein [Methanobrevibacter millerae]|uniref:Zinc-ribbon domain-containing protein n=1 Tax=Methanobrevibacter millerae TaxID=230361 RepID=A0A8T3VCK5_9EURY|nr:zinc ribbon domain-containing protein [Methanobrevibacter millerae]MBE6505708.1 zinc-ribbon domain-containing protein [Methanobrevibacter millerae]
MAKFCDKCGHELKNENVKFCDKCGAEQKITGNSQNFNANRQNIPIQNEEKSMVIALLISLVLYGLGMAYAGNVAKGVGYFIGSIVIIALSIFIFRGMIFSIISLIIWIVGMVLTYQEVEDFNNRNRMKMIQNMN